MTDAEGLSQAEFEAELEARGFVRTDRYTGTGRFWRKAGAHLMIPPPEQGHYSAGVLWDLRRRIDLINAWFRPRLLPKAPPDDPAGS